MSGILNWFGFVMRGGFMMYPLLLSALIALSVIFERFFIFHRRYQTPKDLLAKIIKQINANNLNGAKSACGSLHTPTLAVLATGIAHYESPMQEMELAMKNCAEEWLPILEKRIDIIDTIITAAPLMGLLGTITGMMASFQVLSEKGVNEPNAITGGVAEALIATATGLVIALICLVAYNYLSTRIKGFIYEIEAVASRLMEERMASERKQKK